jgi:hypothetical protein
VLVAGAMVPVVAFIIKPAVEVYIPPCVPVSFTIVAASEEQTGEGYVIVAVGVPFTVTVAVVVKSGQPPAPVMVYLIVYTPALAPDGVSVPVAASIGKPVAGAIEKLPPGSPVCVTFIDGLGVDAVLVTLQRLAGLKEIEADGACVIVTLAVVITPGQGGEGETV